MQPFEDFLVVVHDDAIKDAKQDTVAVLGRVGTYLQGHFTGLGPAGIAAERDRLAGAFADKGLQTELSESILQLIRNEGRER